MVKKDYYKDTREKIIESAIEIINEKGYSKTTLEDIVRNIGLTRGAFYWNFNSKKEILEEIVKRYEDYYLKIYAHLKIVDSAYETIRSLLIYDICAKANPYTSLIRYRIEAATEISDLMQRQIRLDEKFIKIISEQVERGIKQGEFSTNLDTKKAAFYIFTCLLGYDTYATLHKTKAFTDGFLKDFDIDKYVDNILKVLEE